MKIPINLTRLKTNTGTKSANRWRIKSPWFKANDRQEGGLSPSKKTTDRKKHPTNLKKTMMKMKKMKRKRLILWWVWEWTIRRKGRVRCSIRRRKTRRQVMRQGRSRISSSPSSRHIQFWTPTRVGVYGPRAPRLPHRRTMCTLRACSSSTNSKRRSQAPPSNRSNGFLRSITINSWVRGTKATQCLECPGLTSRAMCPIAYPPISSSK